MTPASDLQRPAPVEPAPPAPQRRALRLVWLVGRPAAAARWPDAIRPAPSHEDVELVLDLVRDAGWTVRVTLHDPTHDVDVDVDRAAIPAPRVHIDGPLIALDVPGTLSLNARADRVRYASARAPEAIGLPGGRYRVDRFEIDLDAFA